MRLLEIVILALFVVYPDDVVSSKVDRRSKKASKKPDINGPCGKRYLRQINGKCYYFAGKKMNWFGAQNNCLRKNLNLADLATREEYNGIVNYLKSRGNMEDFWFGGNDLQTEGRFTYISTGRPVRYFGGLKGIEATYRANLDDCLEIRLRPNNTSITDDNCQENQYFVCQTNAVKCAQPVEGGSNDTHHSHEHLHHFHHDAAKGKDASENRDNEQNDVESDSRPADNSNSTEVREQPAEASGENTSANEETPQEENTPMAEESVSTTNVPPDDGEEGTPAPDETGGETPVPPAEEAETPAPPAEEAETPAPPEEGAETPAPPEEGAETPAPPEEGAETPAPPEEGAETPSPPAEGAETPAPPAEGAETPAPPEEGAETPAPPAEGAETPAPPEEGAETPAPPEEGAENPAAPVEGAENAAPPEEGAENPAPPAEDGAQPPVDGGEAAAPENPAEDLAETPAPDNAENPAGRAPKTTTASVEEAEHTKADEAHGKTDLAAKNLGGEPVLSVPMPGETTPAN